MSTPGSTPGLGRILSLGELAGWELAARIPGGDGRKKIAIDSSTIGLLWYLPLRYVQHAGPGQSRPQRTTCI